MKTIVQRVSFLLLLIAVLLLTGCRSSRKAAQADTDAATVQTTDGMPAVTTIDTPAEGTAPKASKLSAQAMTKVLANRQPARGIRAKVNVTLESGSRLSASGSLKMKRDEIIQITLTAILGIEVGRLELTPEYLLIQDRINHQYVKAVWNGVPQLRDAGINFYTFQALFWDEPFVPGQTTAPLASDFDTEKHSGDYIMTPILRSSNAATMAVKFLVEAASGLVKQATVVPASASAAISLDWTYSDWTTLASLPFPSKMRMTLNSSTGSTAAQFALSSLRVDETMGDIHTTIDENRYTHVSIYKVFNKLTR